MRTTSQNNASTTSSSNKRNSDANNSDRPAKQSKISHYFPPLYPVSSNSNEGESQPVPLNDEQKMVLKMVVDEEKNVFFTGAAGAFFPRSRDRLYLVQPLTDMAFVLVRDRKVVIAPGDHRGPEEEICKETSCCLCYG